MNQILKRVWQVVSGLLVLATAAIVAFSPLGTQIVLVILSGAVFVYAVKQLWLYLRMARFMVGGLRILFEGLIAMDFAIFLMSLNDIRGIYVMVYLIVAYLATGAIDLFRAFEIRKLKNGVWKWKAVYGMVNVMIAVLCIIFIRSNDVLCLIYGFGIALTGLHRIAQAFRKTGMFYIP